MTRMYDGVVCTGHDDNIFPLLGFFSAVLLLVSTYLAAAGRFSFAPTNSSFAYRSLLSPLRKLVKDIYIYIFFLRSPAISLGFTTFG